MSTDVYVLADEGGCHLMSGCGFPAPGSDIFVFEPWFHIGPFAVTKPAFLTVLATVAIIAFFWSAFARPKLVPNRIQNLGELGYLFVRDQIARPMIGERGDKYVPYFVTLFFTIWVLNMLAFIPVAQFPVTSRVFFPAMGLCESVPSAK